MKKAIFSPLFKKQKTKKSSATTQVYGAQLSVYDTAYRWTHLSVCCLLRRSGNANGIGNGSENGSESVTVCSERERVSVSETWSGTWSGTWSVTWSGTWSGRGISLRPCPLPRSSSLECGWWTWSGSWSGCGSWSDSWSGSSCGSGSGSCCDFCCPQRSSACVRSILSHQAWRWRSSYHCEMQTQPPLHFCWVCGRPQR